MSSELYKKYRPTTLDTVVGQPEAVRTLQNYLAAGNLPQTILFSGDSGVGKTTLARILAKELGASSLDIKEINCAANNGIDMVREIQGKLHLRSMTGGSTVYIMDECHQITTIAQQSMLKMLEDTPKGTYFFLATTVPAKILATIKTRVTHIQLGSVPLSALGSLMMRVLKQEAKVLKQDTLKAIAVAAEGSARKSLVLLEQVLAAGEDATEAILAIGDNKPELVNIVRELYGANDWRKLSPMLAALPLEEVEPLRHFILSWGMNALTRGDKSAAKIMEHFTQDFFQSKKPGMILAFFNTRPR